MLLSVAGFSLIPLIISQGAAENPFMFNAGWRLGFGAGLLSFLLVRYWPLTTDSEVWTLIGNRIFRWALLFAVVSQFEYAIFAWSIRLVDVSVAAILFETYHVLIILLTAWLFRKERRYRKIGLDVMLLLILGVVGFAFVVSGQAGAPVWLGGRSISVVLPGIGLALLAAITAACSAFNLRWGADLTRELPPRIHDRWNRDSLDLFCVVTASVIANTVAIPFNIIAGVVGKETITLVIFLSGIIGGFVINAMANVAWRNANLITDNLGVNAISYATPIFSLGWLFLFSQVNVPLADYLFIGAAAIITANLLINFEADIRLGFKVLIIALWSCGAFVYLRDDLLALLPFDTWLWTGAPYFQAMALSATVFILLLSFRVVRLVSRTRDEDNRAFLLFQNLDLLARRNLIDGSVREHVLAIDGSRTPEQLQAAYQQAKLCFAQAIAAGPKADDHLKLSEAEAQLNALAYSRQQGIDFGELFALITFSAITVVLALASRLDVSGWTAVLVELFAMLFSAVIIFLVSNVWDLQRDRTSRILQKLPDGDGYGVVFRDVQSRRFEQGTSIIVGLAVTAAYFGLFWHKWLG